FRSLAFFHIVNKAHDFLTMSEEKPALQHDKARGKFVLYALTCRAVFGVRTSRCLQPLPPSLMENRSALRAHAGLGQFSPCPVSVVSAFLIKDIVTGNALEPRGSGVSTHGKTPLSCEKIYYSTWKATSFIIPKAQG